LKAAGCEKIFREKVSGAHADRAQLARLLETIDNGDVLIVSRLVDSERNRHPPLEADNAKSRTDIAAEVPALRRKIKTETMRLDPLNVSHGGACSGGVGNKLVRLQQIVARLRRKDDLAALHAPSLSLAAWRARMLAKTVLADIARVGSAFMAS
jgi:hypothetical protein